MTTQFCETDNYAAQGAAFAVEYLKELKSDSAILLPHYDIEAHEWIAERCPIEGWNVSFERRRAYYARSDAFWSAWERTIDAARTKYLQETWGV